MPRFRVGARTQRHVCLSGVIIIGQGGSGTVQDNLLLLIILCLGLVFNNRLVTASAGLLLTVKVIHLNNVMRLIDKWSMEIGLICLLTAVLTPFAMDKVGVRDIWDTFRTPSGLVAIVGGTVAAYVCGQGMVLLQLRPDVVVGLVVGTVVGVSLLQGIPVGPLAAAGVTAMLLNLLGLGKR
jgi:uncharacterized membrane protein (DUF441 family)